MKASKTTRRILLGGAALVAVGAVFAALSQAPVPSLALEPLPIPNGYDDFVAAGKMLPEDVYAWDDLRLEDLRARLLTNQPALDLARRGLTRKCQSTIGYPGGYSPDLNLEIASMKHLAQLLAFHGKLAEADGRLGDAATDYASILALGIESGRGGVSINCLVEIAIEAIGAKRLLAVVPFLSADESRETLKILALAQADRDSSDKFREHEERFVREHSSLKDRLARLPLKILGRDDVAAMEAKIAKKYQACELAYFKLEAHLAEHAFELEKSRGATNWSDLVPAYLAAIPRDPTTTNSTLAFHAW